MVWYIIFLTQINASAIPRETNVLPIYYYLFVCGLTDFKNVPRKCKHCVSILINYSLYRFAYKALKHG